MNINAFRLGLALLWGGVGTGLLTRAFWAGGALDARAPGRDLTLFGVVALALAAWNLFRIVTTRARRPRVDLADAIASRRAGRSHEVTDPQFDFGEPRTGG